jgi:hypothetical protein
MESTVAFVTVAISVAKVLAFRLYVRNEPTRVAEHCARNAPAAKVSELMIYPVKSMRGHRVREAELDAAGFRFDRRYLVVDAADRFVTQRNVPALATIVPQVEVPFGGMAHSDPAIIFSRTSPVGALVLCVEPAPVNGNCNAPPLRVPVVTQADVDAGKPPGACIRNVVVWETTVVGAVDQGDAAATWLQEATGRTDLRLVRLDEQCVRHISSSKRPDESSGFATTVGFADDFPCEGYRGYVGQRVSQNFLSYALLWVRVTHLRTLQCSCLAMRR